MRKAQHHAWKPNNTPYDTNNENPAHGLDMISSRQRMKTLNFNDNKSQKKHSPQ